MKNQASQSIPLFFAIGVALAGAFWLSACTGSSLGQRADPSVYDRARNLGYADIASIPGVKVSLPYRTSRNAAGHPIYPWNMPCIANRGTVRKLGRAQKILAKQGLGLLVWDAWRPPAAQESLWKAVRNPKYVIPPSMFLSRHCYGIAVDVTLVDSSGRPMRMPTKFDEFSTEASSTYLGFDPVIHRNLEILQHAMRSAGFESIPDEWWHFEDSSPSAVRLLRANEIGVRIP